MLIKGILIDSSDLVGFQCLPLFITAYSILFVFDVGNMQRAGRRLCSHEFQACGTVAILSFNTWWSSQTYGTEIRAACKGIDYI